jgi:hypothetical protein
VEKYQRQREEGLRRRGTSEDLEFDHVDPLTKSFAIGSDLSRAWAELVEEALNVACQQHGLWREFCDESRWVTPGGRAAASGRSGALLRTGEF